MYQHTITFRTDSKPNPGDLPHLLALLSNKSNRCHRNCTITSRELLDDETTI